LSSGPWWPVTSRLRGTPWRILGVVWPHTRHANYASRDQTRVLMPVTGHRPRSLPKCAGPAGPSTSGKYLTFAPNCAAPAGGSETSRWPWRVRAEGAGGAGGASAPRQLAVRPEHRAPMTEASNERWNYADKSDGEIISTCEETPTRGRSSHRYRHSSGIAIKRLPTMWGRRSFGGMEFELGQMRTQLLVAAGRHRRRLGGIGRMSRVPEPRWRPGEHQAALTSSSCMGGRTRSAHSCSRAARSVGKCR
jgi:hypothetical protein